MSLSDEDINKEVQKVLEENRAVCHCETCGVAFLDMPLKDYVKHRSLGDPIKTLIPDKWFIETGIHWAENQGSHQIVAFLPQSVDISQIWENKRLRDDNNHETMLAHFLKYREENKHKAI